MNFYPKTLAQKLIVLLLLIATLPVLFLGSWSYWSGKRVVENGIFDSFSGLVTAKAETLRWRLQKEMTRVEDFSSDFTVRSLVGEYADLKVSKTQLQEKLTVLLLEKTAKTGTDLAHGYLETMIIDKNGHVLASTSPETNDADEHPFQAEFLAQALKGISIEDIHKHSESDEISFSVAAPLYHTKTHDVIGAVLNRINMKEINAILHNNAKGLGETGEIYLVNKNGYMISESRFLKNAVLVQQVNTEPVRAYQTGREVMQGYYPDYRQIPVLGVSEAKVLADFYDLGWLLLIEMDKSEVAQSSDNLRNAILWFGLAVIVGSTLTGIIVGRLLSRPLKNAVSNFFVSSNELSVTTEQQERTAGQQASAVNETSATMEQLGRSAQQSIFQAESANNTAIQAVADARTGKKAMEEMLSSIEELSRRMNNIGVQIVSLSEHTSQIGQVTEVVKNIANQTNLLALNAAVEATRAGEHGKGFTVVSQEIRKLAEQSKKSAEQISGLVDTIQKGTNSTVLATDAGTQITKLSEEQVKYAKQNFDILQVSVNNIAEILQQLALTAKQQSSATNQVVAAMTMINNGAQETAKGIYQNKRAIQQLNKTAKKLQNMV